MHQAAGFSEFWANISTSQSHKKKKLCFEMHARDNGCNGPFRGESAPTSNVE